MAGPTATTSDILFGLYDAYYLRAPDLKGYTFWQQGIANGTATVSQMSQDFYNQQYAQSSPPNGLGYAAMTDDAFVKAIYANVLNGSGTDVPAQAEVDYWVNFLKTNTRGDFVATFVTAALTFDTSTIVDPAAKAVAEHRQDTLWNKIAVGKDWLTTLGASTNVSAAAEADQSLLPFDPAFQAGQKIYSGITYNDSTMTSAENFIASIKTNPDPMGAINSATDEQIFGTGTGTVYHLTTAVETATSNLFDGALFFNAPSGAYLQTLNTGDTLTGTGTTPTLTATLNGVNVTPKMTGIEVFNVTNLDNAVTISGDSITGLKTINAIGSNAAITFAGLAGAPTNVNLTNTASNLTVTVANTALAGATDAVAVGLSGVTGSALRISPVSGTNGYETVHVTSSGATANVLTALTGGNTIKTLTLAGDTKLTIANGAALAPAILDTSLTMIDASADKGGVVIGGVGSTSTANNLFNPTATAAGSVVIKGGLGADSFAIVGSNFDQRYNISDAGGADTLIVVDSTGAGIATATAPTMSGIENLRVTGLAGTGLGASNANLNLLGTTGLTGLTLNGAAAGVNTGTVTLNNLTHSATGFTINDVGNGTATAQSFNAVSYNPLGVSGTADAVTVNINNLDPLTAAPVLFGSNAVTVGAMNLSGIENLTINATQLTPGTGGIGTTLAFGAITDTNLTNFAFTSDGGNTSAGSVALGALGAAAGSIASATINSYAGVTAIFNQKAGASIVLSGVGNDNITLGVAANGAAINSSSASGNLTLTGNTGADTIIGGTGNDTISGGASGGADSLSGGLGADTITSLAAGAVADTVNGGNGIDTIALTAAGGVTTVQMGGAATWGDVITGFDAGAAKDVLDFSVSNGYGVLSHGATSNAVNFATAAGTAIAANVTVQVNTTAAAGVTTAAALQAAGWTLAGEAAGNHVVIVQLNAAGNTYTVFDVVSANADGNITAADTVTVVGTLTTDAVALAAGNFSVV